MKELKRTFDMTKEEVEYNLKLMPYHRKFVKANDDMIAIRQDKSIGREEQRRRIREIRNNLVKEWKEISERISSNN